MALIIVHGIHNDGGVVEAFGLRLASQMKSRGVQVRFFEYPRRSFVGQWFGSHKKDGAALASFMDAGDDIVCHSNGALIWQQSILSGAKWGTCFVFGGAATSDKFEYPWKSFSKAFIIYNPKDLIVLFGSWLPFHPFGKLGFAGYRGFKRVDIQNVAGISSDDVHSHYFNKNSASWERFVLSRIYKTTN